MTAQHDARPVDPDWFGHAIPPWATSVSVPPVSPVDERANALFAARFVLGSDADVEDLIVAAAWIATGDLGPLRVTREQTAALYGEQPVDRAVGPDAARWTPGASLSGGVLPCADES